MLDRMMSCRTFSSWLSLHYRLPRLQHVRIRCQGHVINPIAQAFLFSLKKDQNLMDSYDKNDEKLEEEDNKKSKIVRKKSYDKDQKRRAKN